MPELVYRSARAEDWPAVRALLEACDLPLAGVREELDGFELAVHADAGLVGCAALEFYGGSGLLRSVAVAPEWRGRWIASELVARLLDEARAEGLADVTLFTTTAAELFHPLRLSRDSARGRAGSGARLSSSSARRAQRRRR